tara:strand:+ start:296 stop:490 length:195 start_codon:yes stop_codon:yes gene_type:complete
MLYITTIIERKIETGKVTKNTVSKLVEAETTSSVINKLDNYYNSLSTDVLSYEFVLKDISSTIS